MSRASAPPDPATGSAAPPGRTVSRTLHGVAHSLAGGRSVLSLNSLFCVLSIGSIGSLLSIGSAGSILSIGSAGCILSIGSAGSILSIGSAGSIGTVGRRQALRQPPRR